MPSEILRQWVRRFVLDSCLLLRWTGSSLRIGLCGNKVCKGMQRISIKTTCSRMRIKGGCMP
eukprot:8623419-Karenia_brevis.AAC.1